MNPQKINKFLFKPMRYCGWALLFLMFLFFISGYGATKGVIDPIFSKTIHEVWLPIPTFLAFVIHSMINLKFFLLRKKFKDDIWLNIYIFVFGLIIFSLFLYFYFL